MRRRENLARCILLELNETREESRRESFLLLLLLLRFMGRSEAIAFLEILHLLQDERSKCLQVFTAVIKTTALC